jgi:hypothetical protein
MRSIEASPTTHAAARSGLAREEVTLQSYHCVRLSGWRHEVSHEGSTIPK